MTDEPCIKLVEDGAVTRVVLSNPARRNAFTHAMRDDLVAKMEALNGNPDVRAVVITGEGKHFCVGADISAGGKRPDTRLEMREAMKVVQRLYHVVAGAPKPYVAAVGGDAFGSGMSLALACDFIVGGPEARFGTAFAKLGGYPELAMASTLGRRVGDARAKRLLMLCEHVHARDAHMMGLIDDLADDDHVEAAMALAQSLAAAAPLSLAYIKSTFAQGTPTPSEAIRMELDSAPTLMGVTEDSREGIAAFREKREAKFTGR